MALRFRKRIGYWPSLRRPQTYSERLLANLLKDDGTALARYVDKVAVREYVREKVGEEYLVPAVLVADAPADVRKAVLPRSVVAKSTRGSGMVKLIHDTASADWDGLTQLFGEWLSSDYSKLYRERAYRHVPPRILVEQMLASDDGQPPADYKLYVFGGRVQLFQYISDRGVAVRLSHYLPDGTPMPAVTKGFLRHETIPKPEADLEELIRISEALAEPFGFVRVDLFWVDGRAYFGELTFYPGAAMTAFVPREFDAELGRIWREGGEVDPKWARPNPLGDSSAAAPAL